MSKINFINKMYSKQLLCVLYYVLSVTNMVICNSELPCLLQMSINIDSGEIMKNGSILHEGLVYSDHEYFVHNDTEYRGCVCLLRPCLRKCCPHGSIFGDKICTPTDDPRMIEFNPTVYSNFELQPNINTSEHFAYLYGIECGGAHKYALNPFEYEEDMFYLQTDGLLFVPEMGNFTQDDFCVEIFLDQPKTNDPWPNNTPQYLSILCFPQNDYEEAGIVYYIFPIGLLISSPFLLATFCVYAFIPELRNLHGKSLMNYVFGLFVGFVSLAINQLISSVTDTEITTEFCHTISFLIYFFLMLSFFWLNVMCFDIWLTFRGFKAPRIGRRTAEQRRFIIYCVYAWGSTMVLTGVCALLQYHPDVPNHVVKPGFGVVKCWFEDKKRELLFFYTPVIALVLSNMFLFTNTSFKIIQINKETAMLQTGDSTRHDQYSKDKQRFNLYLKLFLVMGINWIAELLSFIIGGNTFIWIFTDCLNTILGLYIFIIFVWKKKIKNLIIKRYRLLRYGSTITQTRSSSRFRTTNAEMSMTGETDKSFLSESNTIKMKEMT